MYFGGHDCLVVEGGQAGLTAEVLHCLLIIPRRLEDALRLCYCPERIRKVEISTMCTIFNTRRS